MTYDDNSVKIYVYCIFYALKDYEHEIMRLQS